MNALQRLGARLLGLETKAPSGTATNSRLEIIPTRLDGRPLRRSDWNTSSAIRDGLKASTWVYACVRRKARTASSVPLVVQRWNGESWQREENHPLELLLSDPNQHLTGQSLLRYLVYHLELGGEAYWHIVTARGAPVELWPLMPDQVSPIPDSNAFIKAFEYKVGSTKHTLEPRFVTQFLYEDPSNFYHGLSPLMAAANAVDTDIDAVRFNRVAMQNRTATDGVFSTEQTLTADQWTLVRKQVREQHQSPDNARTPWVLGAGMKWQPMTSQIEMDFLESRPMTRGEIYTSFGVPPILDDPTGATFSNMEIAKRVFWEDTMIPLLGDICESITFALVPWFEPDAIRPGTPPTLRVAPDLSGIAALQDNIRSRAETAAILVRGGFDPRSVNDRLELGLEVAALPGTKSRGATPFTRQLRSAAWNDEEKTSFWKARDDPRRELERIAERAIADLFEAEEAAVLESLDDPEGAIDAAPWTPILEGVYLETAAFFAEMEGKRLSKTKASSTFLDAGRLRAWVTKNAARWVKNIVETTRQRVAREVTASLEAGESSSDLAGRLKALYTGWRTKKGGANSRAFTIARTEVGRAANYGAFEGATTVAESLGGTLAKTWVSSRDDRVREEHDDLDGETVPGDAQFSNGLEYPSEPNCRCVLAYAVSKGD